MPFVDISRSEREKFVNQTLGCNIPGYTGHCPTLKFRFGEPYGASTKTINEKLKNSSNNHNDGGQKEKNLWLNSSAEIRKSQTEEIYQITHMPFLSRTFVLGYTGFIPGINFEYGLPFYVAANKSLSNFALKRIEDEKRRQRERLQFINTKPNMCPARCDEEAARLYKSNSRPFYNNNVLPAPPAPPPIAGYTGHIPGMKGNEASLGRYYSAAKAGLSLVKENRKKDRQMVYAEKAVADALNCY